MHLLQDPNLSIYRCMHFEEIRWPEGAKANMAAEREDNLEKP
jgi:hypothetical protein